MFMKETTTTIERRTIIRPMTAEELRECRERGQREMKRWFERRDAMKAALA